MEQEWFLRSLQQRMVPLNRRFLFIDLLRFVAVIFMIEGHVFDALLSTQIKSYPHYYIHDFFHGFVAPAFLFSSGVAYGVSTIKRWEEHIRWGPRVTQRVGRFLVLIGIGYALHLPYFSLRKTIAEATPAEIKSLLQSDAFQCIAVTLLLLQVAVFLTRNRKLFVGAVASVAAAIIFSAPLVWSAHLTGRLPPWLVSYLNAENGSWFPLIPWAAYVLCGVVFGYIFVKASQDRRTVFLMSANVVFSLGIILLALIAMYLPFDVYPAHDFWKTNPSMFFVRLSVVSVIASGFFLAEQFIKSPPEIPLLMGRESLFIYIVHLVIVYGSVLNQGLSQWIGPTLNVGQALGMFVLVLAAITLTTVLWSQLKTKHGTAAMWIRTGGAAVFVFEFIRRPW